MTELVDPEAIERLVGAKRHPTAHLGRAVSETETFYILHSAHCRGHTRDLRTCQWSIALDAGIDKFRWQEHQDKPVVIGVVGDILFPLERDWLQQYVLPEETA